MASSSCQEVLYFTKISQLLFKYQNLEKVNLHSPRVRNVFLTKEKF